MRKQIDELHNKVAQLEKQNADLNAYISHHGVGQASQQHHQHSQQQQQHSQQQQITPDILNILQEKITETKKTIWVCYFCCSFFMKRNFNLILFYFAL